MRERPIRAQYRGPATTVAATPATGGEYLGDLIAQADALRKSLGYERWADLTPLCNDHDPKTLDRRGLVKLIGQLGAMQREGRSHANG